MPNEVTWSSTRSTAPTSKSCSFNLRTIRRTLSRARGQRLGNSLTEYHEGGPQAVRTTANKVASVGVAVTQDSASFFPLLRQCLGVLLAQLPPAPRVFAGAFGIGFRHEIVRRPDRSG